MRTMLKGKIHRARVTSSHLDYEGSIAIDGLLLEAADILPYERVHVLNIANGARFETELFGTFIGQREPTPHSRIDHEPGALPANIEFDGRVAA